MGREEDKSLQFEERCVRVLRGADQEFWDWDLKRNEFSVSARFESMLGYDVGEMRLSPDNWGAYVHPDDLDKAWESIRKHLSGETPMHEVELRCRIKQGGWKWILTRGRVVEWDDEGNPLAMSGTYTDITERKQMQAALEEKERLLDLFIENTPAAIAMYDKDMRYIAVSRRFLEDYRVEDKDVIGRNHYDIFPDIPERWKEFHRRALAGETIRMEEDSFVRTDGSVDWTRWEIRPWYSGGEVGGIILFSEVITERKRAEEALKLAALVFQDSSEAMMVTDDDGVIVSVNPAFERITGFDAEEAVGKKGTHLLDGTYNEDFYKQLDETILRNGGWQGELWCQRKNGEAFAAVFSINASFNPDGFVDKRVILFSDVTARKESDERIWMQANYDALTGLPNRNLFREHLKRDIRNSRRSGVPTALMFLDLDGFKDVNDTLGHDMGDLLLKEAAQRLRNCVRDVDTVARLGGDEFTVILADMQDENNADRVARHILVRMAEPFRLGGETAYVSASIGITFYPDDAVELEDLLKNADQAMYAAKMSGKNLYRYFTASMQEAAQARMRMANDLRGALADNQIEVVYQPIVELPTGAIRKAEALMRWQHPRLGTVGPISFIAVAEESGMITALGNWIFQEAARQAADWREKYHPEFQISINISPMQFRKDGIDYSVWFEQLKALGMSGQGIVVEITEGLLLDANDNVKDQLLGLRDAGIEVALDDFGTGYSSLSYLKKFDIDYIKIDQSFVRSLTAESDDLALCEAITVMAHKLDIRVIAEGIETEHQCSLLESVGCDYGQGYLFSRPVSAQELEQLFNASPTTFA